MAYSSWLPMQRESYLHEQIRWGDSTTSPLMQIHQRLLRLGEAFKYSPCPEADVEEFFKEPLVQWGLSRWGEDSTGGEVESWVSVYGMRENFPRTTLCEYAQRAMCAVITLARRTAIYADETGEPVEMTIAREIDPDTNEWVEYTGPGSWDSTGYDYFFLEYGGEFDPEYGFDTTAWEGAYDWSGSDKPYNMAECTLWLEQIKDVLDNLIYLAVPFTSLSLQESDPPQILNVPTDSTSAEDVSFEVPYVLSSGVADWRKTVRNYDESLIELDEVKTKEPDGWTAWKPQHTGKGQTHLSEDYTWTQNGGQTELEGEWNVASAGTWQTWITDEEPVDTDQVIITDVEYESVSGVLADHWKTTNKFEHYGVETSETFYDWILLGNKERYVSTDTHIGKIVLESVLTGDSYTKTVSQRMDEDVDIDMLLYYYRSTTINFPAWFSRNWMFLNLPTDAYSVEWEWEQDDFGWKPTRKLILDFSEWWYDLYDYQDFPFNKVSWVTYPRMALVRYNETGQGYVQNQSQWVHKDWNGFYGASGMSMWNNTTFGTTAAAIFTTRRVSDSDVTPIYESVPPPTVDVWKYGGVQLNDGLRLGKKIHVGRPSGSFNIDHAEIVGLGELAVNRNQKISVLNGAATDITSELPSIREKHPGEQAISTALLGGSGFDSLSNSVLYHLTEEGVQLDRNFIGNLEMGESVWELEKNTYEIPATYFMTILFDYFAFVLIDEVLSEYSPEHHYHEVESTGDEPYRVSVLPQLGYKPSGELPMYSIFAYLEIIQNV